MSDWQRSQLQCRHEGRQHWLHANQRTLSERQGPGRERRPKWRLFQGSKLRVCMQNDGIFASLVECVLRRSFSEDWRKNGIDPRPTTYQSRRPTRQGQTVDRRRYGFDFSALSKKPFFPVKSITFSTTDLHDAGVLPV